MRSFAVAVAAARRQNNGRGKPRGRVNEGIRRAGALTAEIR